MSFEVRDIEIRNGCVELSEAAQKATGYDPIFKFDSGLAAAIVDDSLDEAIVCRSKARQDGSMGHTDRFALLYKANKMFHRMNVQQILQRQSIEDFALLELGGKHGN